MNLCAKMPGPDNCLHLTGWTAKARCCRLLQALHCILSSKPSSVLQLKLWLSSPLIILSLLHSWEAAERVAARCMSQAMVDEAQK